MIEIYPRLYIGNQDDYEYTVKNLKGWKVIHACKEPYHRQLVGYTGRHCEIDHPEYLMAPRHGRIAMNLIDSDAKYIPPQLIRSILDIVDIWLKKGSKILIHCNQGISRSPMLGFLYLLKFTKKIKSVNLEIALTEFKSIYNNFNPSLGVIEFIEQNFNDYAKINEPSISD